MTREIDGKSFIVMQINKELGKQKFIKQNEKFQKTINDYINDHILTADMNHRLIVLCKDSKKITNLEFKENFSFETEGFEITSSSDFETIVNELGKDNIIFFSFPRY
jgi:hypothetical protein